MRTLRQLPIFLTAIVGTLATVGVSLLSMSWERRAATLEFQNRAKDQLSVINTDLEDASTLIETLRAYFESTDQPVSRAEFLRFSIALHARAEGLRDTGWAPRVTAAERAGFERAVRASGLPDFEIREIGAGGKLVRAGERAEYYPVLYVDPPDVPTAGLDLTFNALRRNIIGHAIRTNQPAATPPMKLVTMARPIGGVMSYLPVYRRETPGDEVERRPDGLVFGAIEVAALIDKTMTAKRRAQSGIDTYVFNPNGPAGDRLVYWKSGGGADRPAPTEAALRSQAHWDGALTLIDQSLGATFVPVVPLEGLRWTTAAALPLPIGLLLTAMVVAFMVISLRRNTQLEALTTNLGEKTDTLLRNALTITHMARHDALTDLPNRRVLGEELESAARRVSRGSGVCAVLQIDLDRFKPINDIHGHAVGDMVLNEVANRLRLAVRSGDIVVRLGGDEFAVVLVDEHAVEIAAKLATRIIGALSQPISCQGVTVEIGASIGISVSPGNGTEPEELLRAADLAMYRSKREGRGRYSYFEQAMDDELKDRLALEADLRLAIEAGQIQPYFQPLVRLQDSALIGFEVLARWHHPQRGVVMPDAFIPVVEDAGLMPAMTYALLRSACQQALRWPGHLFIALNISPSHLMLGSLAEQLLAVLAETGLAARRLELEITESSLLANVSAAKAVLLVLQQAGIRIALDDFGTGYSSLTHLRQLSFDKIKIDRSFVQAMGKDAESGKIVEAVVGLGKSLGVAITAEGIESADVAGQLIAQGCKFGQGYFYGKPMPAEAVDSYLAQLDKTQEPALAS